MQKQSHNIERQSKLCLSGAWLSRGFYAINPVEDTQSRWGLEC